MEYRRAVRAMGSARERGVLGWEGRDEDSAFAELDDTEGSADVFGGAMAEVFVSGPPYGL